jgi:hypothetical protein
MHDQGISETSALVRAARDGRLATGLAFRRFRLRLGCKQTDLASYLNLSTTTLISRVEYGSRLLKDSERDTLRLLFPVEWEQFRHDERVARTELLRIVNSCPDVLELDLDMILQHVFGLGIPFYRLPESPGRKNPFETLEAAGHFSIPAVSPADHVSLQAGQAGDAQFFPAHSILIVEKVPVHRRDLRRDAIVVILYRGKLVPAVVIPDFETRGLAFRHAPNRKAIAWNDPAIKTIFRVAMIIPQTGQETGKEMVAA